MKISEAIGSVNPITLAEIMFKSEGRMKTFLELPLDKRIEVLQKTTSPVKKDILNHIQDNDLIQILEAVDPDRATNFLRLLTSRRREQALGLLNEEVKDTLSTLLEFDATTAAGLMDLNYIQVEASSSIADVAKEFKQHEKRTGRPPIILVAEDGRLSGFLPGHELGFSSHNQLVKKLVKHIPTISYAASHDKVIEIFESHPHNKVAVLNDASNVVGIIFSDDVLRLIKNNEASSLYDFAGVSAEESVTDNTKRKVRFRYKWLIINLGTAFLAAFTVGQFEDVISKYVLLAVYMPIIAGMGGNAATQTFAVLVRGIALKQIRLRTALHTLKSELGAGAINGLINGFLVALVVLIKDHEPLIALVLAMAMVINLIVAAFFGTLVPLVMSRLKKDPAASATIFITTATDVLGFLAFLGLASLILA